MVMSACSTLFMFRSVGLGGSVVQMVEVVVVVWSKIVVEV